MLVLLARALCALSPALCAPSSPPLAQGSAAPAAEREAQALPPEELARLDALFVEDLWAFARWCDERHLYAERERVLGRLLELAPEHAAAREMLGHKQVKGAWKAPERKRAYEDAAFDPAELAARRSEAVRRWRDGRIALVREAGAALSRARVDELLRPALAIAPDDPEVHELLGEQRFGRAWLLAESVRAYEHRPEIRALVARALEQAADPGALVVEEPGERFGFEFPVRVRTPDVLVLSTGTREEALTMAQAAQACGTIVHRLLRCQTPFPEELTLYVLADPAEKEPFLAALPELSEEERAFLATLDSSGIPRSADGAFWYPDLDRRLDAAVRHVLAGFLRDGFHLWTTQAWAWEGLGLYLTREIAGTRLTWYVTPEPEDEPRTRAKAPTPARAIGKGRGAVPTRAELLGAQASWIDPAWRLLKGEDPPALGAVLSADASTMGIDQLLCAYALCTYLLEGRPDELPELLTRAGLGQAPEQIVRESLGLSLEELHARLVRFLSERREPAWWDA